MHFNFLVQRKKKTMPVLQTFARSNGDPLHSTTNRQFRVGTEERKELEDIFGRFERDTEIDHIYSQHQFYGTIWDALKQRMAMKFPTKIYGLLKYAYFSPYTSYLYPWHQLGPNDPDVIEWDEIKMEEGIADLLPPFGVPRILSQTKTKRGDTMERRGIGIFIETGFFKSPEGRANWRLQVAQVAAAVQRTCEFDVVMEMQMAWINQPKRTFQLGFNIDDQTVAQTWKDYLKSDIETFAFVNKQSDPRALINLITRYSDFMDVIGDGTPPDTLVLPPNMKRFYMMNLDDNWKYHEAGPRAYQNQALAVQKAPEKGIELPKFMGFTIVDTKVYRSVTHSKREAGDLLTTNRQIGEWYPMHRWEAGGNNRNIRIHNMEQDAFGIVSYKDALSNCMRFSPDGYKDTYIDWVQSLNNMAGLPGDGAYVDMFCFKDLSSADARGSGEILPCRRIGDISQYFMSDQTVRDMVKGAEGKTNPYKTDDSDNYDNKANGCHYMAPGDTWKEICKWPISLKSLHWMVDNDIPVPITILISRPHMTFSASSGFMMVAGERTGKMFIGHQDFQISNNSVRKHIMGSFTFHSKAVTLEPRNIIGMEDIFVQRYVRGANNRFYDDSEIGAIARDGGIVAGRNSMLAFAISENVDGRPYSIDEDISVHLDIRGRNPNLMDEPYSEDRDLFPCASYYNYLLNIEDTYVSNPSMNEKDFYTMSYKPNVIINRGNYEYSTDYKKIRPGNSHLGPHIYDGVAPTFDGYRFSQLEKRCGSMENQRLNYN